MDRTVVDVQLHSEDLSFSVFQKNRAYLTADVRVVITFEEEIVELLLPRNTTFSGAGGPEIVKSLFGINRFDEFWPAYMLHDYLFATEGLDGKLSYNEVDNIFKTHLRGLGANCFEVLIRAKPAYIFGKIFWNPE